MTASSVSNSEAAPARAETPQLGSPVSSTTKNGAPTARRPTRAVSADPLSDRATEALIRRVLLPKQTGDKGRDSQTPIDELLPPLTSRNDLDLQIYAFLAIILREFVQAWYNKITPDDTFVAEIIHVIAHCTRALEQRFRKLDIETLLLDEVPEMLDRHIRSYRSAYQYQIEQHAVVVNPREAYHALWPMPPLSPVPDPEKPATVAKQQKSEAAYRQLLVQAVLAILLPTEDLQNPCLTALVGQIFSELIIGNVIANKASQPWLLYEAICISERVLREKKEGANGTSSGKSSQSSVRLGSKQGSRRSTQGFFVSIIQLVLVFVSSVRYIFTLVTMSSSLPPRATTGTNATRGDETVAKGHIKIGAKNGPKKVPVLSFKAWSTAATLMEVRSRKPWLSGFLSLLQLGAIHGPGQVAGLDGGLDRLLSHHIQSLLSVSHIPPILRALRGALFPNNAPGSPSLFPPSSEAELRKLRRRAAVSVWNLLPPGVGRVYFGRGAWAAWTADKATGGGEDDMIDEIEGMLDVLGDEYCNKHLMYSVLEIVLVRLLPELADKGVEDLWAERVG